jgi:hypothetical protein
VPSMPDCVLWVKKSGFLAPVYESVLWIFHVVKSEAVGAKLFGNKKMKIYCQRHFPGTTRARLVGVADVCNPPVRKAARR